VRAHEVACDSQHQQSALGAGRRSKISSFDPPLTTVCTAYPAEPLLALLILDRVPSQTYRPRLQQR
jgi:hypothetical protein